MRVVLHGELRERVGESFDVQADSAGDALRAVSLQTNWPQDMLVDVVGFDTEEKLMARTDAEEIHVLPAVYGGGGKFGKILLGAALIAASFIPGLNAAVGFALSGALMSAGIGMVLAGVMQIFMKTPKIDRANDPDASKYLGLNKNTTAIGTPIKLAWGRVNMTPHYLTVQSDANRLVHAVFPTSFS